MGVVLTITIFVVSYIFLLLDKINRALVTICGASLMVILGLFSWEFALSTYVDWSTIGLLFSMMVLISITERTGVFEFSGMWMIKKVKGKPIPLLFWTGVLVAVGSAFLSNVTLVLLFVPILLNIIKPLNLPAFPYLVMVIISCNIGGAATLIGDPPNLLIGQAVAEFNFLTFIIHLMPIVVIIFAITLGLLIILFRKSLVHHKKLSKEEISRINPKGVLIKTPLLYQSVTILILTMLAFSFQSILHVELVTISIIAALLLLLLSENDEKAEIVFQKAEWTTLFFFIGLFVLVGGLDSVGIIDQIALAFLDWTDGDPHTSSQVMLWSSGILSGFVDNIPFVAAMIPVVFEFQEAGMTPINPLWWALALGACLGGNATLIGSSSNIVVAGLASTFKEPIPFLKYMKYGISIVILSLAISSAYIYIRYF